MQRFQYFPERILRRGVVRKEEDRRMGKRDLRCGVERTVRRIEGRGNAARTDLRQSVLRMTPQGGHNEVVRAGKSDLLRIGTERRHDALVVRAEDPVAVPHGHMADRRMPRTHPYPADVDALPPKLPQKEPAVRIVSGCPDIRSVLPETPKVDGCIDRISAGERLFRFVVIIDAVVADTCDLHESPFPTSGATSRRWASPARRRAALPESFRSGRGRRSLPLRLLRAIY